MPKPIMNRRVLLYSNRRFGSLIYFLDKDGRGCLKFTFKSKIGGSTLWREKMDTAEKIKLKEPDLNSVSLDISYKYEDSLLEIKKQEAGKFPEPVFLHVMLPPQAYLFTLKLKNWHNLPVVLPKLDDIVLSSPKNSSEVAIIFSFPGEDGKAFVDPKYLDYEGFITLVNIPTDSQLNKILIGIADDNLSDQEHDLTFQIPEYST